MEEVVGFVFHLEVEVQEAPMVGVVTDSDGQAIQIGSDRTETPSRNGHDRAHLVESGPDPDGPGVAVHPVEDEESEPAEAVEEPAASRPQVRAKGLAGQTGSRSAAQLLCAGRGRLSHYRSQDGEQGRRPVCRRGPQRAVPMRLRQEVQDVPRPARRRLASSASGRSHHTAPSR